MATDLNSITVTGRLGRDPELKTTGSGNPVTRFSIAHNRLTEFGQETSWFYVTVFGELAPTLARRLSKGQHVTVVGRLECRRDPQSGQSFTSIVAEDVARSEGATAHRNSNRAVIAGRLGRQPELRLVGKHSDRPMLTFSVASTRITEWGESTSWINVTAWGEEALRLQKLGLTKGQHVTVEGELEARSVGEGEERRTYWQVVAAKVAVNDRSGDKRVSGHGNGAEEFSHPSQRTTFERYTNELNPDLGDTRVGLR